jgi:putative transposase
MFQGVKSCDERWSIHYGGMCEIRYYFVWYPKYRRPVLKGRIYLSPAQIAFCLKGYTSRMLRREFPELRRRLPTLWSRSYYVGAVGQISKETVEKYITSQKGR